MKVDTLVEGLKSHEKHTGITLGLRRPSRDERPDIHMTRQTFLRRRGRQGRTRFVRYLSLFIPISSRVNLLTQVDSNV